MKKQNRKYIYITILIAVIAISFLLYQNGYIFPQPKDGMIITIYYTDGTYETFNSRTTKALGIVSASGAPISSIKVELYLTAQTTQPITNYDVSGNLRFQILEGTSVLYDSGWHSLTPISPRPTLANNQAVVITGYTYSADYIKSLYSNWRTGTEYTLAWGSSQVTVTAHFPDGDQTQTAAPEQGNIRVRYASDAQFTSLTASFQAIAQ